MPVSDAQRLLVVRPRDLVILSARFSMFDTDGDDLVAGAGGGFVELTFPPQATGEVPIDAGVPVPARLSGPSAVTFALGPGARLSPTADGLLAALAAAVQVAPDGLLGPTTIALPWQLLHTPRAAVSGDALRAALQGAAVPARPGRPVYGMCASRRLEGWRWRS